jgi:hypothetical protein
MVQWAFAEGVAREEVKEIFKVTLPPGTELPELNDSVACCAMAWLAPTPATRQANFKRVADVRDELDIYN